MPSAAGTSGRPGMRIIAPVMGTTKPAPAATSTSRTVRVKPVGRPSRVSSSDKLFWVLAMQMGKDPMPSAVRRSNCADARGV